MHLFLYLYSQVEPSPNNHAANSLAEDVQIRNIRKVKLNADVTFVIWILEWVANLTIYVGWIFSFMGISLELYVLWYYVILANTFLMNTSHNKNCILDDGLMNTIWNGLGIPFDLKMPTNYPCKKNPNADGEDCGEPLEHFHQDCECHPFKKYPDYSIFYE